MEPKVKIVEKHFANNYKCKRITFGDQEIDVDKIHIKDWLLATRRDEIYQVLIDMLKDQPTVIEGDAIDYLVDEYYKDNRIMEYVKENI